MLFFLLFVFRVDHYSWKCLSRSFPDGSARAHERGSWYLLLYPFKGDVKKREREEPNRPHHAEVLLEASSASLLHYHKKWFRPDWCKWPSVLFLSLTGPSPWLQAVIKAVISSYSLKESAGPWEGFREGKQGGGGTKERGKIGPFYFWRSAV